MKKISYQSYCWSLGTTSFRTATLNLKIEEQLTLLDYFYKDIVKIIPWQWSKETQVKYYDFIKREGLLYGEAIRKDKDAREKTSGLVDLGLITKDRTITQAGYELLDAIRSNIKISNIFNISTDGFIYFKQLLKTQIKVNSKVVKPFIILLFFLNEFEYLTYDELTYLIPLIDDFNAFEYIKKMLKLYRSNYISIDDIIYNKIIKMPNYSEALKLFINTNEVNNDIISLIGMNRKSKKYDRSYYKLYLSLRDVIFSKTSVFLDLKESISQIKNTPKVLWKQLLFDKHNKFLNNNPFAKVNSEQEYKKLFFKYMHIFKIKATLRDYFDLNKRYFQLADVLIFNDNIITFDIIPKYYFKLVDKNFFNTMFTSDGYLEQSVDLFLISKYLEVDTNKLYSLLKKELLVDFSSVSDIQNYIKNERNSRFDNLINNKFSDKVLV